jgi:hypothetical protein
MIYLVYEQVLKMYVASNVIHRLYRKEVMLQRVPKEAYLFYILNLSHRNVVLQRGTGNVSSKSQTGALVAITKPMRDTFAPTRSRGHFLGC